MKVNDSSIDQMVSVTSNSSWSTIQAGKIQLKKGVNIFRIYFDITKVELNYVELKDK